MYINATSIVVVVWLAIMCSIVQFSVWFYLLDQGEPGKTSSFLFLAPIFGVLSSWILLGEHVAWEAVAGCVLVCLGIYWVNRGDSPRRVPNLEHGLGDKECTTVS